MNGEPNDIVIGKPDVRPDLPSHVAGVHEGNWPIRAFRRKRHYGSEPATSGAPRRSTGISPKTHGPIDPRMPRLTPP